jgi:hypothetical protein
LKQTRSAASILIIVMIIGLLIGLVWEAYRFASNKISGEGFFIQWISIHALVTDGESPYSDPVTAQIHENVATQNSFAPGNQPKYTSPLYSGAVVFPFALIGDKTLAHGLWLTLQLAAVFAIFFIGIKLTLWKPAWYIFLLFSFFTILSYHVVIPWLDGGMSIWAALFLVLALLAIQQNRNEVAGILLGLSAIQPQMVILPIIFTLFWAVSQKRRILILWFFITVVLISVIGLFFVPDWILQYLQILLKFTQNFPPGSPGYLFKNTWPGLGKQLGWLVSAVLAIILIVEWWLALKKEFRWYLWTLCLTMVISQWIGIPTIPANFIELILPVILISAMITERWPHGGDWAAVLLCATLFIWEWVLYWLDINSSHPAMQLNLIIPLPLVLFIGLYWVRWWAVKPRRLLVEELKLGETY